MVEEKRSDRRQSGSLLLAGNFGLCSEIVGVLAWRCEHRIRRREDLLFSFGSERGPFPKDGPGHLGRPSLSPAWRISPGSITLEDLESVSTTFFCRPCMDNSFRLLFAFASMCRSRQAQFFLQVYRNSQCKRNWHLFRPRPQLFAFCLTLWHPFLHLGDSPSPVLDALRDVHKLRYICMQNPRSQSSWLGLPLRSLCCAIHPLSRLHGALLRKPRNSILLASSNFILLRPGTQHHRVTPSHAADRQAYAYAPGSNKPSWPGWLTEKIKKKEAHLAAMSKKAPACFAKSSGHVFNHPRREIELKESVLGSDWTRKLLMASLATTVDNTIKMADTVRKHGCQWCIRSIRTSRRALIMHKAKRTPRHFSL